MECEALLLLHFLQNGDDVRHVAAGELDDAEEVDDVK